MSTRSIIGTAHDGGFAGRYCHSDGYPTARAADLLKTFRECDNDWETALAYATRPATPGYWSSYMTPSEVEANDAKPELIECWLCKGTGKRPDMNVPGGCNGCGGTGQGKNWERYDGYRTDNGDSWATNVDDWGAEWAYLLDAKGITVLEGSWTEADGSGWEHAGFVAWDVDLAEVDALLTAIEHRSDEAVEVGA